MPEQPTVGIAAQVLHKAKEHRLCQILRRGGRGGFTRQKAVDIPVVQADKGIQRLSISALRQPDELSLLHTLPPLNKNNGKGAERI